tara:strand:- start:3846 stop:4376 length:531 start_codon:yes stop_codon:yes gene_type:complete
MTCHLLAISGSLRAVSSNRALLEATVALAPAGVEIVIYESIGALPHFNPDIADDAQPQSVTEFRAALACADGVIFSTPEYAHGLPGVLKNALDWVVGTSELVEKPVTLFNASPRSTYAVASLSETLTVMSARLSQTGGLTVQLAGRAMPEGGYAVDNGIAPLIKAALSRFVADIGS